MVNFRNQMTLAICLPSKSFAPKNNNNKFELGAVSINVISQPNLPETPALLADFEMLMTVVIAFTLL